VVVPELFANEKITEQEFQTFLEKYKLETTKVICNFPDKPVPFLSGLSVL